MQTSDDYARLVETSNHGEQSIAYAILAVAATLREIHEEIKKENEPVIGL